jgi:hypothetical protein
MSEDALRRREFLQRLGTGALSALALSGAVSASLSCARSGDPLLDVLSRLFDDPDGARAVGAAYLAQAPAEADREQLLVLLTGDRVAAYRELAVADPAGLLERVRAQHREDFEAGRVASVAGWILSHTEARLCAVETVLNG